MSCEYCHGEKPLFDGMGNGGLWRAIVTRTFGEVSVSLWPRSSIDGTCQGFGFGINYCPMCGELIGIPPYEEIEPSTEQLMREEWGV